MSLTTVFQISIYSLTALSALMLAIAEEFPVPAGLTIPFALMAWYVNERQRRMRLPLLWANILGVVAFLGAGAELLAAQFSDDAGLASEARVLAGSHLLTYLTWVAMFQDKTGRQYWWLLGLNCMHVAVGSILTQSSVFGVLMLVFVFLALWTLSTYSLYQTRFSFEQASDGRSLTDHSGHLMHELLTSDGMPALSASSPAASMAWSGNADDGSVETLLHHQPGEFRNAIQLDPNERWINSRFVLGTVTTALLALSVGMVFFTLIPRLWVGQRHRFDDDFDAPIRRLTGFTEEVQLGDIGQILESNEPVFEVRCTNLATRDEQEIPALASRMGYDEPLFRGSVMGRYAAGRWSVLPQSRQGAPLIPPQLESARRTRQRYILRQSSSKVLFGMHPTFATEFAEGLVRPQMDIATSMLMLGDEKVEGDIEYVLISGIPSRPQDRPSIAIPRSMEAIRAEESARLEMIKLPDGLDRLKDEAQRLAAEVNAFEVSELPLELRTARHIEWWLRDSGQFHYSLSAGITDPAIDPVEDFLFNRREGHCEYYASAMALMLRAIGIPSRLVSGFKGGETSTLSGAFVVEQRHAHAWVEAWLPIGAAPRDRARWVTFDPTPALERQDSVDEVGAGRTTVQSLQNIVAGMWHQRIVRLSVEEQRQKIYAPLGQWLQQQVQSVTSPFGSTGKSVAEFLSNPRRWFSMGTFIGTAILLASLFTLRALWRRFMPDHAGVMSWLLSVLHELIEGWRDRHQHSHVDFYERFIRLLSRHGLHRHRAQTQLEFATDIQHRLHGLLIGHGLEALPGELTQHFYRVRFGSQTLSTAERELLEATLSRLQQVLQSNSHLVRQLRDGEPGSSTQAAPPGLQPIAEADTLRTSDIGSSGG